MDDKLIFRMVAERPSGPAGHRCVACSVSSAQAGLFLFAGAGDATAARPFHLVVVEAGATRTIPLPPLDLRHPFCELFDDGRVLLVDARSDWRGPDDFDRNGAIVDPATGEVRRFLAGDGVAGIGIDGRGRIWISYFDEGIFGNRGWSHPGPAGPGTGGLVCFDDAGQVSWSANASDRGFLINDCYALNVAGGTVWALYYDAFGILRVEGDFATDLLGPFEAEGSEAFAVSDDAFLFSGRFREPAGTFHLIRRRGPSAGDRTVLAGELPGGAGFEPGRIVGRGPVLHLIGDQGWFRADLRDLVAP